ncbi:MAG: large repetitive protein [Acidobacteriota bacterium]|nr:large repetitive protein [Acidobacteriota bacterium]
MHRKHFAAAGLLAGLLAAPALGQPPSTGPEFVVNTFTPGNQFLPAVAASPSGALWVAWFETGEQPMGIKARHFDSSGSPLGPELWAHAGGDLIGSPRIGITPSGGFVLVWASSSDVWIRVFGDTGIPVGSEVKIDPQAISASVSSPDVAVAPDGSFFVVWLRSNGVADTIVAQHFSPQEILASPQPVASGPTGTLSALRATGAADGGLLVAWRDSQMGGIAARRYDGPSGAWSAAVRIDGLLSSFDAAPAAVLASDGTALVVWITHDAVLARRLNAAGAPIGSEVKVGDQSPSFDLAAPALAIDRDGNTLVVWEVWGYIGASLQGRLLRRDLTPFGGMFPVSDPTFTAAKPAAAATPAGGFAVAWTSGEEFDVPVLPLPPIPGKDGNGLGVVARLFAPVRCAAGSEVLCLGEGGRFQARVAWKNPFSGGGTGIGTTHPLTSDTGAFWFFNDANLELMVKVLDGRVINDHFWVYAGSLSNVEYTLTVTDTFTGQEWTDHNPPFQFASRADVRAFHDLPLFPGGVTAPAVVTNPAPALANEPLVGCLTLADPSSLCLASGHFQVSVEMTDPRTGLTGPGRAVPLTSDTGAFWFFSDSNLELMVKVLDGRAVNGKLWVFYGGLSDVEYTITVRRPETGEVRTYHNPQGTLASRADVDAF